MEAREMLIRRVGCWVLLDLLTSCFFASFLVRLFETSLRMRLQAGGRRLLCTEALDAYSRTIVDVVDKVGDAVVSIVVPPNISAAPRNPMGSPFGGGGGEGGGGGGGGG
eukprot:1469240-Pleurochrysis_carterae.AAC.2